MPLRFYIIYTRGTVSALSFLLASLLRWSDCRFCLVSNGCTPDEVTHLQQLGRDNARLSTLVLPVAEGIMPHGDALNYLHARCTDDYFCFMDSDIYANGPFMDDFAPRLGHYAGLFSGAALDHPPNGLRLLPEHRDMAGCFSHTADGLCLGSTYFAIYDAARLAKLHHDTGLDWRKRHWHEVPPEYQTQLAAQGLRYQAYEPGKLSNLLLQWQGERLHYQPCPALRHLGGVSRYLSVRGWSRGLRLKVRVKMLLQGRFQSLMQDKFTPPVRYFGEILLALQQGHALPAPPPTDPQSQKLLATVADELAALAHSETRRNR